MILLSYRSKSGYEGERKDYSTVSISPPLPREVTINLIVQNRLIERIIISHTSFDTIRKHLLGLHIEEGTLVDQTNNEEFAKYVDVDIKNLCLFLAKYILCRLIND